MRAVPPVQKRSYPSFGRCVYCLEPFPGEALTDEHIIPLALNGELVIKEAACEPCRDRSNQAYETRALQQDFLVPRLLLGLKRRKKNIKRTLPKSALGNVLDAADPVFDLELEALHYPPYFGLLVLQPAGLITGTDRGSDLRDFSVRVVSLGEANLPAEGATTEQVYDHTASSLMTAKIAYCYAAAELGLQALDTTEIRALLTGERNDVYNFVGGADAAPKTRLLHKLQLRRREKMTTVLVHLFAASKAPPFEVVVGRPIPDIME